MKKLVLILCLIIMVFHPSMAQQSPKKQKESLIKENKELERFLTDESMVKQVEQVLEETVAEALDEQEKAIKKDIQKITQKRDFWRRTAVTELILLSTIIFTGFIPK